MKIVKRVLNEQEIRRFDEDELELLDFIFERELKPPFRKGAADKYGDCHYYNRDGEEIGWLYSRSKDFTINYDPFKINVMHKVCQVFGFSRYTLDWWDAVNPHLKSWLKGQFNIQLRKVW